MIMLTPEEMAEMDKLAEDSYRKFMSRTEDRENDVYLVTLTKDAR